MEKDMFLYQKCHPNQNLIDEIFAFDVKNLDHTDDIVISQYVIGLSQYLIYFKNKTNEAKQRLNQKKRLLDASISQLIDDDIVKQYKTKKDAAAHLIYNTEALNIIQNEIDEISDQNYLLEGTDKTISEYIAAFKRELTRRENELYQKRNSR